MQIYDLHAFTMRDLDNCEVSEHVDGLTPVLSTKDEQWFVVSMLSGRSQRLEELEPADLSKVRESIASHLFSKLLSSACHQVRESGEEPSKAEAVLARADYAQRFGSRAVETAERQALEEGFLPDDIGMAYNTLEVRDPVAAIPVTCVSDLQKVGEGAA